MVFEVPIDGLGQPLFERVLGLPAERFLGSTGVGCPVTHADGLVCHVIDLGGPPVEVLEYRLYDLVE